MLLRNSYALFSIARATINSIFGNPIAPSPVYMQIEPTNYCNQTCIYCQRRGVLTDINNKNLTLSEFKQIVDQMPALKTAILSGFGEPLLNKELFDMIRYAKSKRIKVQTVTNMTLLTPETADNLVKSGLDELFISIDSTNPKTYQKLRGHPIESALKGLNNLTTARKALGVFRKKPKIMINAVFTNESENLENLKSLIDLSKEHNLVLRIKSLQVWGAKLSDISADFMPEVNEIKKYAKKMNVDVKFNLKKKEKRAFCYRIWFGGFVSANGNMFACCDNTKEPNFGNIFNNNFRNIWNCEQFRNFRKSLYNRDVSAFAPCVKINCINCNLKFNDSMFSLGKVTNPLHHRRLNLHAKNNPAALSKKDF